MPISFLKIRQVGPFNDINFHFDPSVNVFVGPNNSGKSTVLACLGDIAVYPFSFPKKLLRDGPAKFTIKYSAPGSTPTQKSGQLPISLIYSRKHYWTPERSNAWVRFLVGMEYATFIPAIRQISDYRSKGPLQKGKDEDDTKKLESRYKLIERQKYLLENTEDEDEDRPELEARAKASFGISAYVSNDEDLIQRMIDLDYRAYRENKPGLRTVINKIAAIASEITEGFPLEFVGFGEDSTGLFPEFRTTDGIVPFNVLSQGTHSIIHSIAQVVLGFAQYYKFPSKLETKPGILIIDEIDAHLHPSWQRRFIPALRKHFPRLQIFCSTHSPLMLGGLKAGQIQLLNRSSDGSITVTTNEYDIKGWSLDEVVRNVMDVAVATDLMTEEKIRRLQYLQNRKRLSAAEKKEFSTLRRSVSEDLISGPADAQIKKFGKMLEEEKIPATSKTARKPVSKS